MKKLIITLLIMYIKKRYFIKILSEAVLLISMKLYISDEFNFYETLIHVEQDTYI